MKKFITSNKLKNIIVILFWIIIWHIGACLIDQSLYLPSPLETISALFSLLKTENFYLSVGVTLLRVLAGLSVSIFLGIFFGFISAKVKLIQLLFEPLVSVSKSIPIMSIIILLIVWLQGGTVPIMVCFMLCFPIIYTNTLEGILSVDNKLLEMANVFNVSRKNIFNKIILPSVKPHIFSGIIICIGFSWKAVVTAEVLSAPKFSMGYNLLLTKIYLNIPELFAWTLAIIIISIIIEKGFKKVFKWLML